MYLFFFFFFFQAEDGIRDAQESRGLGDVYKRQYQRRVRGINAEYGGFPLSAMSNKAAVICLVFNVLAGLLLWALAIFTLITDGRADTGLLSVYLLLLGGVLMLAQFEFKWLHNEACFLSSYFGRGMLTLFLGTLCLGMHVFGIVAGVFVMGVAGFNFRMFCMHGDSVDMPAPTADDGDKSGAYGTGNPAAKGDGANYTPASDVWQPTSHGF
eukprot:TRINITY_DN16182_c0_g1_i2.p1 TRINITY_DN16182_c0_g1~~TRINITY_DN16182_c0_g1_i2.p1  ORF type:complete len:212 (+),score=64.17 TRINITY_DN16182_c0_g1_i2:81-716(+)